ncbi:MAG: chorismate mutase, partial [Enterobacteriaceae bacterium]
MMNDQLLALRQQITDLDIQLLDIITQRNAVALSIARTKQDKHLPIRDEKREKELLNRLICAGKERKLEAHYVTRLFQLIIEESVLTQQAQLQHFLNQQQQD